MPLRETHPIAPCPTLAYLSTRWVDSLAALNANLPEDLLVERNPCFIYTESYTWLTNDVNERERVSSLDWSLRTIPSRDGICSRISKLRDDPTSVCAVQLPSIPRNREYGEKAVAGTH